MDRRFDATAHLLLHLHDGSALRTNPIVARHFSDLRGDGVLPKDIEADALARVRAFVSTAVDHIFVPTDDRRATAHALRQRVIIERCDFRGEPHMTVAVDLGLSRREFYRERKRARLRLAEHFDRVERRGAIRPLPNEFDLRLTCAGSLCELGRHEAAIASLEVLRSHAVGAIDQIRVNVAQASAYCEVGRIQDASEAICRARDAYTLHGPTLANKRLLWAEIETAAARLLRLSGKLAEADAKHKRILTDLRVSALPRTSRAIELEALSWMRLGMLSLDAGDGRASTALLRRAAEALGSLPNPPPPLKAELLGNLACTRIFSTSDHLEIQDASEAYLAFSREHNLLGDMAGALANLAALHLRWGDVAQARAYARNSLDVARYMSCKHELSGIFAIAAEVEAEAGDSKAALELVVQGQADAVPGSLSWANLMIVEAKALSASHAYRRAWRVAGEAAERMSALGTERYTGVALRVAAEAAEHAGRNDEALRAIREAIRLLGARGSASALARAYVCSARLTHSRYDAERARELSESSREPRGMAVPN